MPAAVERWIVCFTGWRQDEGQLTGIEKIQDAIHRQCTSETTRVLLKSWKDSPSDLAQRIWNRRPADHPPRVVIVGYSYGGYTAVLLARELARRGLGVETMLLVDAVWRPFAWFPSLLSMLRWWTIEVPSNVSALYSWQQKKNRPCGHDLLVSNRAIWSSQTLNVIHEEADDHPSVSARAMSVACPEEKSA